jgi:magnesium transporter
MTEILQGLDDANRTRVGALRGEGRFFWIDASAGETSADELGEVLSIPSGALQTLLGLGAERRSAQKFSADGRHVVFKLTCYVDPSRLGGTTIDWLRAVEVHVLVCREYLLTLHEERVSLPKELALDIPAGRSEQYVVYTVLEAMVTSAFDALNEVELRLDDLATTSTDLAAGRVRMASLRAITSRLSAMRRQVGPQRGVFERIGVELARLEGLEADDEPYFDRITRQVNRLVDAIDAAVTSLATLIDLRLNETIYWLTVVATIFLPLTFLTGFFGMNFGWMIKRIDTSLAFWLLGVGTLLVGVALIWRLIVRAAPVEPEKGTEAAVHHPV